jgi:hypothetical protein
MRLGTWLELVRRARIHKDLKFACLTFASYADADGTGITCSRFRLAADLDVEVRTAERRLKWMRDAGLIEMTQRGNRRRGRADEYRLTAVPEITAKYLEAPDPAAYRKYIGELAEANRTASRRKYRRKVERDAESESGGEVPPTNDSTDSTSDGWTPVDNSSGWDLTATGSTDSTSDGWTAFQPTESANSTDNRNSLTCEDVAATSHEYTLHGQIDLPCGADTAKSPSYRPHAREAASTPIQPTRMNRDDAARYTKAAEALATLADFGLAIRDQIRTERAQRGETDVDEREVVIEAADRFTRRGA